jgi:L-fuculose-phosphate aldolase
MSDADLREEVASAARRLAAAGLVIGTAGNVSVRDGDRVAVTASGTVLEAAGPEHVTVVDRRGEVIDGTLKPSSEIALHLGIYDRYGAGAVVHTHAPMATALACVLDGELPCVHYGMLALGGAIPVAPYRTFGTPELADVTVEALQGKLAALMACHGAITHGQHLDHAVENSLLLEWVCTVYWRASMVGEPKVLSEEEQQAVVQAALGRNYGTVQQVER